MKTDYPELEGREISYIYNNGEVQRGKIIGVSYHLGITVVAVDNLNLKLICLNKKIHGKGSGLKGLTYRQWFQGFVKQCQKDVFRCGEIEQFYGKDYHPSGFNNQICAFE